MPNTFAEVLLDDGIERPLDYRVPDGFAPLSVGCRVVVPLQKRKAFGTVVSLKESSSYTKVRFIEKIAEEVPSLPPDLMELAEWISSYYVAPLSRAIKTVLPSIVREESVKEKVQKWVRPLHSRNKLKEECEALRTKHPAQAAILDSLLQAPKGILLTKLLEEAKVSMSPVQTLIKKGFLSLQEASIDRSILQDAEFFSTAPKTLTDEQSKALEGIRATLGTFATHLLFGVTGSGKTEIYLQAMDEVLKQGRGVIYLVPEIALTAQTIERVKSRFGSEGICVLHYRLSQGERADAWKRIRRGEAKIVIGARSALFSPFPHLGLIIVDEEHESSYKQSEESPKYNARDVAIVRGKIGKCPVILGSATPSLESYENALSGKYLLHRLQGRPDQAKMPKVTIVDMKLEFEKAKGFTLFSDQLLRGIEKRFAKGEQTLLFLNRRGYHTSALCSGCGYTAKCPHCELALTYHLGEKILACHLCDYRINPPHSCPECHRDGPLKFKGAGTEMVERALHALFPEVRTLRLDADTTKHKGSHEAIFRSFRSGKADILIGTQMIAKGLHFPLVTLVGVLAADGALSIPDFRSSEQVFQLLTQVSGRSGRGELAGEVILQTHLPDHPLLSQAAKGDYLSFFDEERKVRSLFRFPPFTRLVKFSFSGEEIGEVEKVARETRERLIERLPEGVEILPVSPCGYAKIKGNFRFQFLLKTEKIGELLKTLKKAQEEKGSPLVRMGIEVDPLSTYF